MKFTCEIEMDNAAFEDAPATELARIMRKIVDYVKQGSEGDDLRDINGNKVGRFAIMGD
jgi:hypothetical protein